MLSLLILPFAGQNHSRYPQTPFILSFFVKKNVRVSLNLCNEAANVVMLDAHFLKQFFMSQARVAKLQEKLILSDA